jgi:hypothetical protein
LKWQLDASASCCERRRERNGKDYRLCGAEVLGIGSGYRLASLAAIPARIVKLRMPSLRPSDDRARGCSTQRGDAAVRSTVAMPNAWRKELLRRKEGTARAVKAPGTLNGRRGRDLVGDRGP